MENKLRTITITLTHNCNLACTYCYEHHKSKDIVSFDIARKIIDYELTHVKKGVGLEFDLFGGEPFLEFDLIKKITNYVCENKGDTPCILFATSNGTLIHGEIQDWLIEHKGCFVCGLSLDGNKEMQDINRCNSFDDIDLNFFLTQYPDQDIKMTISKETLPYLFDGVKYLQDLGFLVSCNLAFGIDWSDENNSVVLQRELTKLIDYYLDNPDIQPCSILNMGITNVGVCEDRAVRYCGAGNEMRAYDIDGTAYPCQFFMPLSVGNEKAKASLDIVFPKDVLPEDKLDDKCKHCVIRSICPTCYGSNYASTGDIFKRDDNMCRLTKIIAKANSYFKAEKWKRGQLDLKENEEVFFLKAISSIQEKLDI